MALFQFQIKNDIALIWNWY